MFIQIEVCTKLDHKLNELLIVSKIGEMSPQTTSISPLQSSLSSYFINCMYSFSDTKKRARVIHNKGNSASNPTVQKLLQQACLI